MIDINDVITAVGGRLESWRPQFDAAISAIVPDMNLGAILPFVTGNISLPEMPVLMIGAEDEESKWIGMPLVAQETFRLSIWGMAHHEQPELAQRLIRALASQVKAALNHQDRLSWPLGGDREMYFDNIMPVARISYGVGSSIGSSLVPTFNATFASNACIEPSIGSYIP